MRWWHHPAMPSGPPTPTSATPRSTPSPRHGGHHPSSRQSLPACRSRAGRMPSTPPSPPTTVVGVVLPDTCLPGGDLFTWSTDRGPRAHRARRLGSGGVGRRSRPAPPRRPHHPSRSTGGERHRPGVRRRVGGARPASAPGRWPTSSPGPRRRRGRVRGVGRLSTSLGATADLLSGLRSASRWPPSPATRADGRRPGTVLRRPGWPRPSPSPASRAAPASTAGPSARRSPPPPAGSSPPTTWPPCRLTGWSRSGWWCTVGTGVDDPPQQPRLRHPRRRLARRADGLCPRVGAAHAPLDRGVPGGGRRVGRSRRRSRADPPLSAADLVSVDRLRRLLDAHRPRHSAGAWPSPAPAVGGTTYLCCRDGNGLGVSLIQSNFHGIGSGLSAGDTGVFLHDRRCRVLPGAGPPQRTAPGKPAGAHTVTDAVDRRGRAAHAARDQGPLVPAADPPPDGRPPRRHRARPGRGDAAASVGGRRRGDRPERGSWSRSRHGA